MRHIFISYSHLNKETLKELVKFLENNGYTQDVDIWFDDYITLTNDWRDEIEEAIIDAFCMIYIATEESLKSEFCTYEWAYALGYGVPVITIVWQKDLNIPQPLARNQFLQVDGISQNLLPNLSRLKGSTVEQLAISIKLSRAARPFRVLARLSIWMAQHKNDLIGCEEKLVNDVIDYATETAKSIWNEEFLDIFLQYHNAMSKRQRRYARQTIKIAKEFFHQFWSEQGLFQTYLRGLTDLFETEKLRLEKIEPILQRFIEDEITQNDEYYEWFDRLLVSIEKKEPLKQVGLMTLPLNVLSQTISDDELRTRIVNCISKTYKEVNVVCEIKSRKQYRLERSEYQCGSEFSGCDATNERSF